MATSTIDTIRSRWNADRNLEWNLLQAPSASLPRVFVFPRMTSRSANPDLQCIPNSKYLHLGIESNGGSLAIDRCMLEDEEY